jgi:hypothetical protein
VPLGCIHQSKCCMSCRMRCSPAPDTRICTVGPWHITVCNALLSCCVHLPSLLLTLFLTVRAKPHTAMQHHPEPFLDDPLCPLLSSPPPSLSPPQPPHPSPLVPELVTHPITLRAKPHTAMQHHPEPSLDELLWTIAAARIILSPHINIQAPPNLTPAQGADSSSSSSSSSSEASSWRALLDAGINDWGRCRAPFTSFGELTLGCVWGGGWRGK